MKMEGGEEERKKIILNYSMKKISYYLFMSSNIISIVSGMFSPNQTNEQIVKEILIGSELSFFLHINSKTVTYYRFAVLQTMRLSKLRLCET